MRQPAVSLVIEHCLIDGAAAAYETWLEEIVPVAKRFAGHQGIDILRPGPHSTRYILVLRFDRMEHLRAWLDSAERAALIRRIEPWLETQETLQAASGLDYLFNTAPARPPRPFKQFLLTLSAIYPLTTVIPLAVKPLLAALPWLAADWSSNLLIAGIIVYLMVYVVMPPYTKLVSHWLNA